MSIFGFELSAAALVLGLITGMTYGLLAVGLVLVFRSNRIINFAHGQIGALSAAAFGIAVVRWRLPYWGAFPFAMVLSALIGVATEMTVVRRLRSAPTVMSVVATLGVAQFLLFLSFAVNSQAGSGRVFPQPPALPTFSIGALRVTQAYTTMLVLAPVLVTGLVLFLRKTRFGMAIRASAANPWAARTSGVFIGRMSSLSWAIAGGVSAFTAILVLPTRGFVTVDSLGPALLLRALVGAVLARMTSLPVALAGGIGVGIVEQALQWNYPQSGIIEAVLFCAILVILLTQRRIDTREDDKGQWAAVLPWSPLPEAVRDVWAVRYLGWIAAAVSLAAALAITPFVTNASAIYFVVIVGFGIVGLSLGIVSGLSGQLSLGQFAVAGLGATASGIITANTGNYLLSFLAAGALAAGASVLIGLPALRIRGLMLAVTTLSFALAAQAWLFQQPWLLGQGRNPGRPIVAGNALDSGREYFLFSLVPLIGMLWLCRNVWRSGIGRRLRAIRDNEDAARAFTIDATKVKLQAFATAGFVAGIGGAVYGHSLARISAAAFPVRANIDVVALSVLGGLGMMAGPLLGALYIIGVPRFVPLDSAGLAATSFGWLILVLYFPGGIAQLLRPLRDRIVAKLASSSREEVVATDDFTVSDATGAAFVAEPVGREEDPDVVLACEAMTKRYGGVVAVDAVSLEVRRGETLGLIGPNGAGKTTLFELLSGFAKPDAGRVVIAGTDVSTLDPPARGRLGLIRSFQDAALFPTLTVLEVLQLAFEREDPTRFSSSVIGLAAADRRKEAGARELAATMGLDRFKDRRVGELSTGTRRITELACLIALRPLVLLLDEPSSGIAQRETEALGGLLQTIKDQLQTSLVIIEHDMPLVMGLSDRVVAMAAGSVVAKGTPSEIQSNPVVIESYLGTDTRAIERSDHSRPDDGRCEGRTRAGARCRRRAVTDGLCAQHALVGAGT